MNKSKYNLRNVVAIAICLAGMTMFSGCNKDDEKEKPGTENPDENVNNIEDRITIAKAEKDLQTGTVDLSGVATVEIPNGVFSAKQKVVVEKMTSVSTMKVFDENAELFDVTANLSYFVRVSCPSYPQTDNILITFSVPDDLANKINSKNFISVFAQFYDDVGQGTHDDFSRIDAEYNASNRTASVNLPKYAFSKDRTGAEYEAVLTLATTIWDNVVIVYTRAQVYPPDIVFPLDEVYYVTSPFGPRIHPVTKEVNKMHNGIDLRAAEGVSVYAADDGVVENVGSGGTGGKTLTIKHTNGNKSKYMHLNDNSIVSKGDKVAAGQYIAKAGNTGRSSGAHLHFEYIVNGRPVNPDCGAMKLVEMATVKYNEIYNGEVAEPVHYMCFDGFGERWRFEYKYEGEEYTHTVYIYDGNYYHFGYYTTDENDNYYWEWQTEGIWFAINLTFSTGLLFKFGQFHNDAFFRDIIEHEWDKGNVTRTTEEIAGQQCVVYGLMQEHDDVREIAIWKKRVALRHIYGGYGWEANSIEEDYRPANAFTKTKNIAW